MIVNIRDFLSEYYIKRLPIKEGLKIQVNEDILEFKNNEWHLVGTINGPKIDKVILNDY
jgi:hypothetical protein